MYRQIVKLAIIYELWKERKKERKRKKEGEAHQS
jgi:hypothetical protein